MLNIKKIVSGFIISSLILLLVTACAELDSHSAFNRFQKSEDLYRASMRWGEWTNILQLIRPRPESPGSKSSASKNYDSKKMLMKADSDSNARATKQESYFEELLVHLDTIHVSNVEILSSAMNKSEGTGESRLLIQYRFDTSAKINSIRHTVSWWYDKQSNTWFTYTSLPKEFDLPKHRTIKLSPTKRY